MISLTSSAPVFGAQIMPQQGAVLDHLVSTELFFPAALLIIGVLLMLFGYKAYKWIVMFNCVALGFWIGGLLGQRARLPLSRRSSGHFSSALSRGLS